VLTIGTQFSDVLRAHRPDMSRADRRARSAQLLEMVGIPADRLSSYPHELSGGMRQRVMIATALALDPSVVIMDEPTTALDVVTQREILEELMTLRDRLGFAVLFISHDLSLLVEIADSIAVMYAGRLVERADANAIFRAPRHPYSLGLLSSFPALHGPRLAMEGIPGSPPDLRDMPSGCSFHPRCGYAFDRCLTDLPPLLDLDAGTRAAACWLQDGHTAVPAELARPVTALGPATEAVAAAGPATAEPEPTGGRS
jgi:peptide/nickel transport system ATP-binding protein